MSESFLEGIWMWSCAATYYQIQSYYHLGLASSIVCGRSIHRRAEPLMDAKHRP
jgi:hypothetical protein